MEQKTIEKLVDAITRDDVQSFSFIMQSKQDYNICFGRFPLLSVLYLFGSYKILSLFETDLMPIHNFKIVDEDYRIYKKFKKISGRILKLYVIEEKIVYPIEMLSILDDRIVLIKKYKLLYKNIEIINNISKIYKICKNLNLIITESYLEISSNKLSKKQKISSCFAIILCCVMLVFSLSATIIFKNKFGLGTAYSPILIESEIELQNAIKKGSKYYKLKSDIALTNDFEPYSFGGSIDGDGYCIYENNYLKRGLFLNLSGEIKNVSINIEKNAKITKNYAIIAEKLTGTIKNCEINGELSLSYDISEDTYVSLFVVENNGKIIDSTVMAMVNLVNEKQTNAFFSCFVGLNSGEIVNSEVTSGEVVADTVDVAGIVCENNGKIDTVKNYAKIKQISNKEWYPNTAGICLNNTNTINNASNYGEIISESTLDQTNENTTLYVSYSAGICVNNYSVVSNCYNEGKITTKSIDADSYASGIVVHNYSTEISESKVEKSLSKCDVVSESQNRYAYASGIACVSQSYYNQTLTAIYVTKESKLSSCGFVGNIVMNANTIFGAGIVNTNIYSTIQNCYSSVTFSNLVEKEETLTFFASLISLTYAVQNISNNYYVANESYGASVFRMVSYGNTIVPTKVEDKDSGAISCVSLNDIPKELIIKW